MKKGISVNILSYKEAENLDILLPIIKDKFDSLQEEYEINIIDSIEPLDNTKEICDKYSVNYINQKHDKFGGAYKTAIDNCTYDKFFIMDADGSHNPIYIKDIYDTYIKNNCDICIGSRYVKGGKSNDSLFSKFMSKILNFVFSIIIGVKVKDMSTDFRLYNAYKLKKCNLQCKNYDIIKEILLEFKLMDKNTIIREIPIVFDKRMKGESKRKWIPFIISYFKSMFLFIGKRLNYKKV